VIADKAEQAPTLVVGALPPATSDRPRRFEDDARNDAYWARVIACVDAAPPLTAEQKLTIRAAFSIVTPSSQEAA